MNNIKENFAYQIDGLDNTAFFVLHLGPTLHVSTKKDNIVNILPNLWHKSWESFKMFGTQWPKVAV